MAAQSKGPPLRIALLLGGDSAERAISLKSGAAARAALQRAGHRVTAIDPAECALAEVAWSDFDACFVALHGGAGEDGRVQQELQRLGVPYTGSGPEACRLAMSKIASKERFLERSVPTLPFVTFDRSEPVETITKRVAGLGYPVVVKPDSQGSSIGIAIAETPRDLPRAVAEATGHDATCLAEPLVAGREFTVAVLDDRALPLLEIVSPERLFSYTAKYQSTLTEYRFEFELAAGKRIEILHAAVAAAQSLGTCGLARVDLMLGHDGRAWVLEVNTVPGMTERSLAPQAARRAGLELSELCEVLVRQCLAATEVS